MCDNEFVNGQCNLDSGKCECQHSTTFPDYGFWTMSMDELSGAQTCETCDIRYFGEKCADVCKCNGHGLCDRRTGACGCYLGDEDGYWGGKVCADCADGFVGITCKGVNVKLSRPGAFGASFPVPSLDVSTGLLCYDVVSGYTYIGTNPIAILDNNKNNLAAFQLKGFALQCYFRSSTELYIYAYSDSKGYFHVLTRGTVNQFELIEVPHVTALTELGSRRMEVQDLTSGNLTTARLEELIQLGREAERRKAGSGGLDHIEEVSELRARRGFEIQNASAGFDESQQLQPVEILNMYHVGPTKFGRLEIRNIFLNANANAATRTFSTNFKSLASARATNNGTLLLTGIKASGDWDIEELIVDMEVEGTQLPVLRSYYSTFSAQLELLCGGCVPVRIEQDRANVVMVLRLSTKTNNKDAGMYLGRMVLREAHIAYDQGQGVEVKDTTNYTNAVVAQYVFSSIADVTSLVVDTYSGLGYVALRPSINREPSTIFKFVVDSCVVTGTIALGTVGGDMEVAIAMHPNADLRKLDVLAPLALQQRVIEISLFAVAKVVPEYADTKGGTIITLHGEGFVRGMRCDFGGRLIEATFDSSRAITCPAPAGGTESCTGEVVEAVHKLGN